MIVILMVAKERQDDLFIPTSEAFPGLTIYWPPRPSHGAAFGSSRTQAGGIVIWHHTGLVDEAERTFDSVLCRFRSGRAVKTQSEISVEVSYANIRLSGDVCATLDKDELLRMNLERRETVLLWDLLQHSPKRAPIVTPCQALPLSRDGAGHALIATETSRFQRFGAQKVLPEERA